MIRAFICSLVAAVAAGSVGGCGLTGTRGAPTIEVVEGVPSPDRHAFELHGISGQDALGALESRFTVRVVPTGSDPVSDPLPPMAGSYAEIEDGLRFEPAFALSPGVHYRAEFNSATVETPVVLDFTIPKPEPESLAKILAVYPSAEVLPQNLLKFYIHFSKPMAFGHVYRRVRLREEDGAVVKYPFLELDEELWDRDNLRVTVFLDPGRVKRGLVPHEEVGPVLAVGKSYVLEVESGWLDAHGFPLEASFEKRFSVGPADRRSPDADDWIVGIVHAGTRDSLRVRFEESLDRALLERLLSVWTVGEDAMELAGEVEISRSEREWAFTPARPWTAGSHELRTESILEDLAGNNLAELFEVDVFETVDQKIPSRIVALPFVVEGSHD